MCQWTLNLLVWHITGTPLNQLGGNKKARKVGKVYEHRHTLSDNQLWQES